MNAERPEYPETKSARRKGYVCAALAIASPFVMAEHAVPYAFTAFLVLAALFLASVESDRLHRRVDALRNGD